VNAEAGSRSRRPKGRPKGREPRMGGVTYRHCGYLADARVWKLNDASLPRCPVGHGNGSLDRACPGVGGRGVATRCCWTIRLGRGTAFLRLCGVPKRKVGQGKDRGLPGSLDRTTPNLMPLH